MMRHPYKPANKAGTVIRIHTTADSVRTQHRDLGPCLYIEHGALCGKPERVGIHREPFFMTAYAKDEETSTQPSEEARKQRDVPVL